MHGFITGQLIKSGGLDGTILGAVYETHTATGFCYLADLDQSVFIAQDDGIEGWRRSERR